MSNTTNSYSEWEYRNIALAVMVQCAQLVHTLATTGDADQRQIDACIAPVFVLDPDSLAEVYPDVGRFNSGLTALERSLGRDGMRGLAEAIQYVLGMTVLQQHLGRSSGMPSQIRRRLQFLRPVENPSEQTFAGEQSLDDAVVPLDLASQGYDFSALAQLYQDTISQLSYRIHVKGVPEHLQNQRVADRIRALLLAGIRSAQLWHQLGGRRWHLFFFKKRIRASIIQVRRSLLVLH